MLKCKILKICDYFCKMCLRRDALFIIDPLVLKQYFPHIKSYCTFSPF